MPAALLRPLIANASISLVYFNAPLPSLSVRPVVRPGYTFRLAPGWPGMLANKRARLIVVSRDSYQPASRATQMT